MRKIICGLVIVAMLVGAGAVQAATIVKTDKLKYDIKFDWQIQLRQKAGEDEKLVGEYDDMEFKNGLKYQLAKGWYAQGQFDIAGDYAANSGNAKGNSYPERYIHLEEAWVGFGYDKWRLVYGKRFGAADHFGIQGSKETTVKKDAIFAWGGSKLTNGFHLQGSKLGGQVNVELSYEMYADGYSVSGMGSWYDAYVRWNSPIGFQLGAMYQNFDKGGDTPGSDDAIGIWGIEAGFSRWKFLRIAADYSVADTKGTVANLTVVVPVKSVNLGAGYVIQTFDDETSTADDITGWWAHAIWYLPWQKNVRLGVEITDDDREGVDMGYLAFMRLLF